MLFHRRTLSRATITAFTILVMLVVMCQGRAADIQIPLKNETVTLGENGYFFCRILGAKELIYFNRMLYSDNPHVGTNPDGVTVEVHRGKAATDNLRVINVNITIVGSVQHNETLVSCSDHDITASQSSYATFIVQGGPAKPEVSYEVLAEQKEIVLLWPRPFTWEEYPITEYHIMCTDTDVISINNTDNRAVIQHTVELDQDITDCHTLQCNVTACNVLDDSIPSVTDISIPLMVEAEQMPTIQLEKHLFTEDKNPEVVFCVKLPVLCSFQNVTYTLIISHEGGQVLELSRQFSYSSGYNSECIEVLVTEGLQEGTQYTVQVFMDAGLSGSSYSDTLSFRRFYIGGTTSSSNAGLDTRPVVGGVLSLVIILISGGSALVIILLILKNRSLTSTLHGVTHSVGGEVEDDHKTVPTATNMAYGMVSHDQRPSGEEVMYEVMNQSQQPSSSQSVRPTAPTDEPAYAVIPE